MNSMPTLPAQPPVDLRARFQADLAAVARIRDLSS
jgi:hypothetical protein